LNCRKRYPVRRKLYIKTVGELLEKIISQAFNELGFRTEIAGSSNGVDIKVFDKEDDLFLVAEILNWSPRSWLSHKRKNNIIHNLSKYDCARLLIYTCMKDENLLQDLMAQRIQTLKIGFQILPKNYYNFYFKKNQVDLREADSEETREEIKMRIIECVTASDKRIGEFYLVLRGR
jgi:hypothetical protein